MKFLIAALVIPLGLLSGCGEKQKAGDSVETNSSSPLTAPVDYLDAVHRGQQRAASTAETASLNQAVQLFQVEHGRYPNDLNELVKEKYLPRIPEPPHGMRLTYDPQTGQVRIVRQ